MGNPPALFPAEGVTLATVGAAYEKSPNPLYNSLGCPNNTSTSNSAPTPDGTVHVTAVEETHSAFLHFFDSLFREPPSAAKPPTCAILSAGVIIKISSGADCLRTSAKSLPKSVITLPPDAGANAGDTAVIDEPSYSNVGVL